MTTVLAYALIVFFGYHVVSQSDLLERPRSWLIRVAPGWLTYPLSCPLCFAWWTGVMLTLLAWPITGDLTILPGILFVAPVINLFLGLLMGALKRIGDCGGETAQRATVVMVDPEHLRDAIDEAVRLQLARAARRGGASTVILKDGHLPPAETTGTYGGAPVSVSPAPSAGLPPTTPPSTS